MIQYKISCQKRAFPQKASKPATIFKICGKITNLKPAFYKFTITISFHATKKINQLTDIK